jgi:putative chitinase
MKFDRKTFFTYARRAPFSGRLTQQQVDGMSDMLDYIEKHGYGTIEGIAYFFASVHHETGGRMVPVRETYATSAKQAIARLDAAFKAGRLKSVRTPYWRDGWFGRGRIQVTHKENYEYAEKETGIALTKNPDLLLQSDLDCRVSIPGTFDGWWTRGKHKISDYFNLVTNDAVGARRIVNGTDKAQHIADNLYKPFLGAFNAALVTTPLPIDVTDKEATADGKNLTQSTTVWSAILTAVAGGGASLIAAIDNPYALAFGIVAVIGAAWIIRERMRHAYEDGA